MKLTIADKEVDLGKGFPMTIGDSLALEASGVFDAEDGRTIHKMVGYVSYWIKKVDSSITDEQIKALSPGTIISANRFLMNKITDDTKAVTETNPI